MWAALRVPYLVRQADDQRMSKTVCPCCSERGAEGHAERDGNLVYERLGSHLKRVEIRSGRSLPELQQHDVLNGAHCLLEFTVAPMMCTPFIFVRRGMKNLLDSCG